MFGPRFAEERFEQRLHPDRGSGTERGQHRLAEGFSRALPVEHDNVQNV